MKRQEFDTAVRRAAWARANGRCEGKVPGLFGEVRCSAPIDIGRFVYEHLDPDYFSKNNQLENCAVYCLDCAKRKTRKDHADIGKSKRIQDKRIKARKPRWRPIPGSKRSGVRKRMSGRVERW